MVITAGVLFAYQYAILHGSDEETTRAMVFATLIVANIFLSLVNRSFVYSMFDSFKYENRLFPLIIGTTLVLLFAILYLPSVAAFFHVSGLTRSELGMTFLIAGAAVLWFEVYKWIKRRT